MPVFFANAVTDSGRKVKIREEATTEADLIERMEKAGFQVTRILSVAEERLQASPRWTVKKRHLVDFSDRLQIMYSAGIPIVEALEEVKRGTTNPRMRAIVQRIKRDVEEGARLSEAIAQFPRVFPPQYRAAVTAGEQSGALDRVLGRLVKQLEWEMWIRGTVTQAFIYPAILFTAVCGMLVMLFAFLLPRITKVFAQTGVELPWPTRFVMSCSDFLRNQGLALLSALVALALGTWIARRTAGGKRAIDRFLMMLPAIGATLRKVASARFVSSLRTLHHAGCPILTSLHLSRPAAGNATVEADVEFVTNLVEDGVPLTDAMCRSRQLEPLVPRMVAVGERSGSLTEALDHVVALYDREVQAATKRLLGVLEPTIIVFSGLVVGFIVIATLMPMFKLLGALR